MVKFYDGIDGLKTGYTDKAGYCLTATMKKNNMRLVSIVMGEDTKDNRSEDTVSMMEYGYSMYGSETILKKENFKEKTIIENANNREVNYYLNNDVSIIAFKDTKDINYKISKKIFDIKAPIKKNTIIGKLTLTYNNKNYEYDLIVKDDIEKNDYFSIAINIFKDIISGINIRNIV